MSLQGKNRDGIVERTQEVLRDDGEGSTDGEDGIGAAAEQPRYHGQQIENAKSDFKRNEDEIGKEFAEIVVDGSSEERKFARSRRADFVPRFFACHSNPHGHHLGLVQVGVGDSDVE